MCPPVSCCGAHVEDMVKQESSWRLRVLPQILCFGAVRAAHLLPCCFLNQDASKHSCKSGWKLNFFFLFFKQKDQAGKFGLKITFLYETTPSVSPALCQTKYRGWRWEQMLEEVSVGRGCWYSVRRIYLWGIINKTAVLAFLFINGSILAY